MTLRYIFLIISSLIIESSQVFNHLSVMNLACFLVSILTYETLQLVFVLLKVLRNHSSSLNNLNQLSHIYLRGLLSIKLQHVQRDVIQVLLDKKLPLIG